MVGYKSLLAWKWPLKSPEDQQKMREKKTTGVKLKGEEKTHTSRYENHEIFAISRNIPADPTMATMIYF